MPSPDYYRNLGAAESGGDPEAQSSTSSAYGPYQFTSGTWNSLISQHPELGLTERDRYSPQAQAKAIQAFTADNQAILRAKGIPLTDTNTYMAHFLGPSGGAKFVNAYSQNPDTPVTAAVSPAALAANREAFYNKNGTPKTVGEVYSNYNKKFGGGMSGATSDDPFRDAMSALDSHFAEAQNKYQPQSADVSGLANPLQTVAANYIPQQPQPNPISTPGTSPNLLATAGQGYSFGQPQTAQSQNFDPRMAVLNAMATNHPQASMPGAGGNNVLAQIANPNSQANSQTLNYLRMMMNGRNQNNSLAALSQLYQPQAAGAPQ